MMRGKQTIGLDELLAFESLVPLVMASVDWDGRR